MGCCISQIMSLDQRLAVLSKSPETVKLTDLIDQPPSTVVGARRVLTRFGKMAIVLNIQRDDIITSVFLPNKFTDALDDGDLENIVQEGYKITVTCEKGGSYPNVLINK